MNTALHMAAIMRMTYDEETRIYVEKHRAEGRSNWEIRRCIKRYLARRIFKIFSVSAQVDELPVAA